MSFEGQHNPMDKIVIVSPCEYELFYKIGLIVEGLGACYTRRVIDLNNLYWSFIYSGQNFILHYDVNAGAYLYPVKQNSASEKNELASQIARAVLSVLEESYVP